MEEQNILQQTVPVAETSEQTKSPVEQADSGTLRTHRVGSVTLGLMLVIFGIVFLARLFVPSLTYDAIWHLWPCTLISLGIEVLVSTFRAEKSRYDGWGILLIFLITIFTMGMAGMENMYSYFRYHW